MNILICIGENYRDFAPLRDYAYNLAKEKFGIVHQILFYSQTSEFLQTLEFTLQNTTQCLLCANNKDIEAFLDSICTLKFHSTQKNKNQISFTINNQKCTIFYVSLGDSQEEDFTNPHTQKDSLLYLYPLGFDAQSAQLLLQNTADKFQVNLKILNTTLGILSAFNGDLQGFQRETKDLFGTKIFSSFNLAQDIIALLSAKNLKITTAESCTGGLIAYTLTEQSGASAVFDGGVISYANAIKEAWLDVQNENLMQFGAVSEAVVRDMLNGALKLSGADFALATSGIAGPSGGSPNKPVGMVYIGAKSKETEIIECLHFKGNRNYIQSQATLYAYLLFLKIFLKNY